MYKLTSITVFLVACLSLTAQISEAQPSKGIAEYSFQPILVTQVFGQLNLTQVEVVSDYLRNGMVIGHDSFSVQLNAYTTNGLWVQDVLLVQVVGKTVNVTPVINVWNVTGSKLPLANYTVYRGLAVYVQVGKPFLTELPLRIFLNLTSVPDGIVASYEVNGVKGFTVIPLSGATFQVGGAVGGLPADAELVIGGPGGGSVANVHVRGNVSLYLFNGTKFVAPIGISRGISTGEGAEGFNVFTPSPLSGFAVLGNASDRYLLWPHPSDLKLKKVSGNLWLVSLTSEGKPLAGQRIEVYAPSSVLTPNGTLSLSVLKPIAVGYTNSSGEFVFTYNGSLVLAYYPGNSTILPAIATSSGTAFPKIIENTTQAVLAKLSSLKYANLSFPLGLKNEYANKSSESFPAVDTKILSIIAGYVIFLTVLALTVNLLRRSR
ncbi:MAG: thermopsin family protease [Thermoprotei archaeon]